MAVNYRKINYDVMVDTKWCYETIPELRRAVEHSVANQFMVEEEDNIDQPLPAAVRTQYVVSGKRSFEAAAGYDGKKVAVLNYANNHSIGGAPFSAGAQEESLCRCSTLLPCLQAMREPFYMKHQEQYRVHEIDYLGNDDLIYTPDVVVFKTDERTDPVYPQIQRIKKILDVAAMQGNEVVILGAWGCGAFKNPIEVVAKAFVELVRNYDFETVEFALATVNDVSTSAFARYLRQ